MDLVSHLEWTDFRRLCRTSPLLLRTFEAARRADADAAHLSISKVYALRYGMLRRLEVAVGQHELWKSLSLILWLGMVLVGIPTTAALWASKQAVTLFHVLVLFVIIAFILQAVTSILPLIITCRRRSIPAQITELRIEHRHRGCCGCGCVRRRRQAMLGVQPAPWALVPQEQLESLWWEWQTAPVLARHAWLASPTFRIIWTGCSLSLAVVAIASCNRHLLDTEGEVVFTFCIFQGFMWWLLLYSFGGGCLAGGKLPRWLSSQCLLEDVHEEVAFLAFVAGFALAFVDLQLVQLQPWDEEIIVALMFQTYALWSGYGIVIGAGLIGVNGIWLWFCVLMAVFGGKEYVGYTRTGHEAEDAAMRILAANPAFGLLLLLHALLRMLRHVISGLPAGKPHWPRS